mmetsp:Transcript_20059/g.29415  ORF Transcript_20059/g.29415 Transcript_20059/m.29415 type:complete len:110 (+) Transcript_20059:391-720(+)
MQRWSPHQEQTNVYWVWTIPQLGRDASSPTDPKIQMPLFYALALLASVRHFFAKKLKKTNGTTINVFKFKHNKIHAIINTRSATFDRQKRAVYKFKYLPNVKILPYQIG